MKNIEKWTCLHLHATQEELEDHVGFSTDLESLTQCLERSESVLTSPSASIEHLQVSQLTLNLW